MFIYDLRLKIMFVSDAVQCGAAGGLVAALCSSFRL